MIRKLFSLAALMLVVASCVNDVDNVSRFSLRANKGEEFFATIEGSSDPETKVFADSKMRVLWNADDRIAIFIKTSYGYQYSFTGEDGANAGGFSKVTGDDEFVTGIALDHIYAVYPYASGPSFNNDKELLLTLPAEQIYKENSFGIGANTMVSVSDNNQLQFKNVGGYLSFKLYGDGISVKSITIKGKNGEKLAGSAKVTMAVGGTPTTEMQETATESITLTCETPVALGSDADHCTEFWFVVPPTTLTKGFTITVTDTQGGIFEMASAKERVIARNTLVRLSAMKVVPTYAFVPFEDANFKAYCVENFDADHDDEISLEEADAITRVKVITDNITSLGGIEYFHNLTYLRCYGSSTYTEEETTYNGQLASLDVSRNAKLDTLYCQRNPNLTSLSLPSASLKYLNCSYTGLKQLNLNNYPLLATLSCGYNDIEDLDVSACPSLEKLYCQGPLEANKWDSNIDDWATGRQYTSYGILKRLNVSNCTNLKYLNCTSHGENLTEVIGLSDCVNLEEFLGYYCDFKQLDFSNSPKLNYLYLSGNINLASLNLTNCPELDWMSIWDCRKLTSLDLSHNKAIHSLYYTHLQGVNMSDLVSLTLLQIGAPASKEAFDLSQLVNLQTFNSWHFYSLDLSHNVNLINLWIGSGNCSSIDLSPLTKLESLKIEWFGAETLDISKNTKLTSYNTADYSNLQTLYVAPGQQIEGVTVNRSNECIHPNTTIEVVDNSFSDPVVETGSATTGQTPKTASENTYYATVKGQLTVNAENYTANRYFYYSDTYSTLSELRMSGIRVNVDEKFTTKLDNLKENTTYYYVAGADVTINNETNNYFGEVRSFKTPSYYIQDCVDLDLPSGIKWGTKNLGATTSADIGTKYNWCKRASNLEGSKAFNAGDILLLTDDHAQIELGGYWRTPTYAEWQELLKYCDIEYSSSKGLTIKSKKNSSHKIFIPNSAAYWTATCATAGYYTSTGYYMWPTAWVIDQYSSEEGHHVKFSTGVTGGSTGYMSRSIRPVYVDR